MNKFPFLLNVLEILISMDHRFLIKVHTRVCGNTYQDCNMDSQITHKLKSSVIKRRGRGFSKAEDGTKIGGLRGVTEFDTLEQGIEGDSQKSVEGWVIFVSGLNEETTEDELYDCFSEFGNIKDLRVPLDHRTGYAKGYALLKYSAFSEAKSAIDQMNGDTFINCVISCDFAFISPRLRDY